VNKTHERPSRRGFLAYALLSIGTTLIVMLSTGCPTGTKTTVGISGTVKVDPQNCKENRGAPVEAGVEAGSDSGAASVQAALGDLAILDCASGTVGGTVQIVFPRKQWQEILSGGAPVYTGPGK
jgi:hypothetical protein